MKYDPPVWVIVGLLLLVAVLCLCEFVKLRIIGRFGGKVSPWRAAAEVRRIKEQLPSQLGAQVVLIERVANCAWLFAALIIGFWYFGSR